MAFPVGSLAHEGVPVHAQVERISGVEVDLAVALVRRSPAHVLKVLDVLRLPHG